MFLSSACASTAGSVDVVSKEAERTSISGCSGGVNGGSREEEDNPFHCSALDGSTTVSENRGVCSAGIIYNTPNPPRQLTRTSDESGRQEGSFCGGSECGSGESMSGGDGCTGKHRLADFGNSNDASRGLSSISSDHRASSIEPVGDSIKSFSGGGSSSQILWVGCVTFHLKVRWAFHNISVDVVWCYQLHHKNNQLGAAHTLAEVSGRGHDRGLVPD